MGVSRKDSAASLGETLRGKSALGVSKRDKSDLKSQLSMGTKSVSSVQNVADVNPVKPGMTRRNSAMGETFGKTFFKKKTGLQKQPTQVLDATMRGGFGATKKGNEGGFLQESAEQNVSQDVDDVRMVSMNSKGFQNLMSRIYKDQ